MNRHDFGIIFWLHWAVIALFYTSPFLFDPWYIIAGAALFYLQNLVLGDCVLSRWQFKHRPEAPGFFRYYFTKWGFADPDAMIRNIDRSRPIVILFSMLWQWGLGYHPLIV